MTGWVKVRSWHQVRTFSRVPGVVVTLCGKRASADDLRDSYPSEERTCESCFRASYSAIKEAEGDRLTL